jgi:hypothetical protein
MSKQSELDPNLVAWLFDDSETDPATGVSKNEG